MQSYLRARPSDLLLRGTAAPDREEARGLASGRDLILEGSRSLEQLGGSPWGFLNVGLLIRLSSRNVKEQLFQFREITCNCCSLIFIEKCLLRRPPSGKPPLGSSP